MDNSENIDIFLYLGGFDRRANRDKTSLNGE
jgi:hypothetical protein